MNSLKKKTIKNKKILFFLLSLIFFSIGLFTLKDYGINWDEPYHYIRGQAFIRYLFTGKKDYKGMPELRFQYPKSPLLPLPRIQFQYETDKEYRRSIYQYDFDTSALNFDKYINEDKGHPPVNGELASLFNGIFYQKLGILGDIESYHLFIITISALLVFFLMLFANEVYGFFSAIITGLSLMLYPIFLSESHFNIKDPVSTVFYSFTILFFYHGVIKNRSLWIILSAVMAGLALGTKFNIFFAGISLFVWVICLQCKKIKRLCWPFSLKITLCLVIYPLIAIGLFILLSPNLWHNTLLHLSNIFGFYKSIGYDSMYQTQGYYFFGINTYAMQWVLFTTPLVTLVLCAFGICYTVKNGHKEKNKTSFLILLWFLVPIVRVSFSHAGIYGGLRQIMEYIPAMAMLAGIGGRYIISLFNDISHKNNFKILLNNKHFVYTLILLLFLPISFKMIAIHPNENVYFNPLIGGLKGAKERNFSDWGVTLGSTYEQGIKWINLHAEKNANGALVYGLLSNVPRTNIRSDINFYENHYSGKQKKGEYLIEETNSGWEKFVSKEKRDYIASLIPVYEVKVDGVRILGVWKNDLKHTKN